MYLGPSVFPSHPCSSMLGASQALVIIAVLPVLKLRRGSGSGSEGIVPSSFLIFPVHMRVN